MSFMPPERSGQKPMNLIDSHQKLGTSINESESLNMASKNLVHCACGFEKTIQVGGTRFSFQEFSTFPHFCKSCGLVEANVAKDPVCCPKCKSTEITAYGEETLSNYKQSGISTIQHFSYRAQHKGNLCPQCNQFTLLIDTANILFD